ncbi:hypothetical protein [Burkholderia vietnamiensis]|uniref:hypothetical protein n=1 Tax=Burkholderia vietnamiensis TaxID=60552 RepID=UPI00158A6493|nr:hypothetical protein [Burkholderia vietnamiensis]
MEPRSSGDFVSGKLSNVLPVDPPLGFIEEARGKHAFTPQHRETSRCLYDFGSTRIDLSDRGIGLFDPLFVWLYQIHAVFLFIGGRAIENLFFYRLLTLTCSPI